MTIRYLLDTNICIYIAKHNPPEVRARFEAIRAEELAMSVVTLGELQFGIEKSQQRSTALVALQRLVDAIQTVDMTPLVASHYGQIRAALQKSGQPIGNNDLWLAAHARAMDWVLVTNNEREFVRVPNLKVENWVN